MLDVSFSPGVCGAQGEVYEGSSFGFAGAPR